MSAWSFLVTHDVRSKNAVPHNPHARARMRNALAGQLKLLALNHGIQVVRAPLPQSRGEAVTASIVPFRAVTLTRYYAGSQRKYDDDGLSGGSLVLLRDVMQPDRARWRKGIEHPVGVVTGAGIVYNDGPKWSRWVYRQERVEVGDPRVGKVGVEIQDEEQAP